MDLGQVGFLWRRNEKQLPLARHMVDPRDKIQGTAPASLHLHPPASSSPAPGQELANPNGFGLVALGTFSPSLEGLHGGKEQRDPVLDPHTAQMISALTSAGQGSQQP